MDYKDLVQQFSSKERSVSDVIRYLSTRADDNSNYSLLLGAGCSITSGVRSASSLVELWRKEVLSSTEEGRNLLGKNESEQRAFLQKSHSEWYDPTREYSSLFERRYDLQRQRRMFVEKEVSGAFPSIGYTYLTSLVEAGLFRTIFTTNFDDLINEAFYSFSSERPIVCAQDSSISSVTVTSKRPKVIKLHGDYLFDDLKSTIRETESLQSNMRSKFTEFAKEAGIIVVGYSGSDRSIMDILSSLLKNDEFLKGGVYWCLREDSEVSEELRRLLWRDRIYFVKIKGFDEFFAEIFSELNGGDAIPPSLLTVAQPSNVVDRLLSSHLAIPETTDVLQKAKKKLASLTKRSAIANLLVHADQDDRPALRGLQQNFTDDELLVLTEARSLVDDQKYEAALHKVTQALRGECRPLHRRRLLEEHIRILRLKGETENALTILDQLLSLNPDRGSTYLLKAAIEPKEADRYVAIKKATEVDPFLSQGHLELARWHMRAAASIGYGEDARQNRELALKSFQDCIDIDPSRTNPAWRQLCAVSGLLYRHDKNEKKRRQDEILRNLAKQGTDSFHYLDIKLALAIDGDDLAGINEVVTSLKNLERKRGLDSVSWVADLLFDGLKALQDPEGISELVDRCDSHGLLRQDPDLAYRAASALRKCVGDEPRSLRLLLDALREWNFDSDVLRTLFDQYIDLGRVPEARKLFDDWSHRLAVPDRLELKRYLFETEGNFEGALHTIDELEEITGYSDITERIYILLRASRFQEAEKLARQQLEKFNFTPEAFVETINYELAKKRLQKKIDTQRLENLIKASDEDAVKAAVSALQGRRDDLIKALRNMYKKDKTFRFTFLRWPVFFEFWSDQSVRQAAGLT